MGGGDVVGALSPSSSHRAGLNCQAMDKAPAWIGMGWGSCRSLQVWGWLQLLQDQVLINQLVCVGLIFWHQFQYRSLKKGLHLFGFVVAYTYHKMHIPLWGSFRKKGSLSPGGAPLLDSPIAKGGKDSPGLNLSSRQEAGSPRTKGSLCICVSVPWKACKSFPPMKILCYQENFNLSHLTIA